MPLYETHDPILNAIDEYQYLDIIGKKKSDIQE